MAVVIGQSGIEAGDKKLYNVLHGLPNEFRVYAQPILIHKDRRRDPDYIVLHKNAGVIVLEVKDWVTIVEAGTNYAMVQRRSSDEPEREKNPVNQARTAAFFLKKMLEEDEDLCNYAKRLDFPYRFATVLPQLPLSSITKLEKVWGETFVFGSNAL